jgi:hypothetical protein
LDEPLDGGPAGQDLGADADGLEDDAGTVVRPGTGFCPTENGCRVDMPTPAWKLPGDAT